MKATPSLRSDYASTSLTDGSRVSKADARVEAYGTVDELNSHVGLLLAAVSGEPLRRDLLVIQRELFGVGGLLAQPGAEVTPWVAESAARWLSESRRLLAEAEKDIFAPLHARLKAAFRTVSLISPLLRRAMFLAMARPRPMPPEVGLREDSRRK